MSGGVLVGLYGCSCTGLSYLNKTSSSLWLLAVSFCGYWLFCDCVLVEVMVATGSSPVLLVSGATGFGSGKVPNHGLLWGGIEMTDLTTLCAEALRGCRG